MCHFMHWQSFYHQCLTTLQANVMGWVLIWEAVKSWIELLLLVIFLTTNETQYNPIYHKSLSCSGVGIWPVWPPAALQWSGCCGIDFLCSPSLSLQQRPKLQKPQSETFPQQGRCTDMDGDLLYTLLIGYCEVLFCDFDCEELHYEFCFWKTGLTDLTPNYLIKLTFFCKQTWQAMFEYHLQSL